MTHSHARYSLLVIALLLGVTALGTAPCYAEPLMPVRLEVDGRAVSTGTHTALYDGREVYVPLASSEAFGMGMIPRPRQDSADVLLPDGASHEIALTRLHGALMFPLTPIAQWLKGAFTVHGDLCVVNIANKARSDHPPATPPQERQSEKARGGAAADGAATEPIMKPAESARTSGVDTTVSADPVQKADGLDTGAREVQLPSVDRSAGGPMALPSRGSTGPPGKRNWTILRNVLCEAIDPSQTRVLILADGPLRPLVTMRKDASQIAIDLAGIRFEDEQREWIFNNPLVAGVRAVPLPTPGATRLLVTLKRLVTYRGALRPPDGYELAVRLPKLTGRRIEEMTIVIDPGHGGASSTGCSAIHGGSRIVEKRLTLQIASRVRKQLAAKGLNVIMTRTTDKDLGLKDRPALANRNLADVFVSIHVDDAPGNARASGTTAYYHRSDENSRALAHAIARAVSAAGKVPNRGARSDLERFRTGMAVLRTAEMPAILLEVAFISNPSDRAKLVTEEFQTSVAEAVAAGVINFVEARLPQPEPVSGAEE